MDFKSLATVLVFNIITQAIPIGATIYFALRMGIKEKSITIIKEKKSPVLGRDLE